MTAGLADLQAIRVELTLTAGVLAVLGWGILHGQRAKRDRLGWVVAAALVAAMVAVWWPVGAGVARGEMVIDDALSRAWKAIVLVAGLGLVAMECANGCRYGLAVPRWTMLLGALAGFCLTGSTNNVLVVMLALETSALSAYGLAAMGAGRRGNEAALKLVIFGSAASAVMIFGMALAAGETGSLQVPDMAGHLMERWHLGGVPVAATVLISVGLAFKLAAVPFHVWAPDVMEGGDATAAATLSLLSKGAAVVLALRWWGVLQEWTGFGTQGQISFALAAAAIVTMTMGNLGALRQANLRRMLGYASVAQSGYLLAGLAGYAASSSIGAPSLGGAVVVLLVSYMPATLAVFAAAAASERPSNSSAGSADRSRLAGLARRQPWVALALAVCLISLIGLPPGVGVVGKLGLLLGLGRAAGNGVEGHPMLNVVQGAVVLNTVVSAVYYLRVVRTIYFDASTDRPMTVRPSSGSLIVACALVTVAGTLGAAWLVAWAARSFAQP